MYQQSVDRSGNSSKADLLLFFGLVVLFFVFGAIVLYLENVFSSTTPRYIFIAIILAAIYMIYRVRLIGFRYTVFYKELEPVYDPRFDAMTVQESYPYPVGTVIFERIVSAKGTFLLITTSDDIVELCAPGELPKTTEPIRDALNCSIKKVENSYSLIYKQDGILSRLYFNPDDEFIAHLTQLLERKIHCD